MTHRFRITYRIGRNYAAQIINAPDLTSALKRLGETSIVRVALQCEHTTANGEQCRRFTSTGVDYRCAQHQRDTTRWPMEPR